MTARAEQKEDQMTDEFADLHRPVYGPDLLITALERNHDKPALYLGDVILTGGQMRDQISCFAQALASLGITQGTSTAMLSKNRPEVLISMGATMITGCRASALNPMGSLDDHKYIVDDAEIETLIFDPNAFEERAAELKASSPSLTNVLSMGPSEVGIDILALAATFEPAPLKAAHVDAEDASSMVYTGGTTGKPKGVVGSFRSGAALNQIQMSEWQWPEDNRFLICTPLSHAGAAFFIPTLLRGGALIVLPAFEPGAVLEAIEKHKITATMLVPTMIYMLMDHPDLPKRDVSSLQTLFYGASAMSPARLQEGIKKFGQIFFQFYGQTECGMTISVLRKEEHLADDPARLATCGRPVPWLDVRLLDDDLNEVPQGELGEICVPWPADHEGLLEEAGRNRRGVPGWLAAHRRHRAQGQGRVHVHRRSQEGHDRDRWFQRVPPRNRRRDLGASVCRVGGGGRCARRQVGRSRQGLCRTSCRTDRRHRGTGRQGEGSQGFGSRSQEHRLRGITPADTAGQAGQEGAARAVLGDQRPRGLGASVV